MAQTPEEIVQFCIDKKTFATDILYKKEYLELFINTIREKKIAGPFRKSMFTQHSTLMRRFKEQGITLLYNRRRGNYYIQNEEFYEAVEPVTFDPDLLYLDNIES